MEERHSNKDRITKTGDFPQETTKKLGSSKKNQWKWQKKSHKETVQQEKTESIRIKTRRQCVVGGQKYPIEMTFKKARLEKIWTFWNHKKD